MRKTSAVIILLTAMVLSGCEHGTSAEELTKYYAEQTAKEAAEIARDEAEQAARKVNQAIDENETASKVRDGAQTVGEYAQDAYDYATDENTAASAKERAKEVQEDSINLFDYMINKIGVLWDGVLDNVVKGSTGGDSGQYSGNLEEELKNASEYDFYGDYTNPFKEAKGIDTSSEGTAMDQLKVAFGEFSEETKQTIENIKKYHDERHPASSEKGTTSANGTPIQGSNADGTESITVYTTAEVVNTGDYTQRISEILLPQIPEYNGNPYCIVNDNKPFFDETDYTTEPFEMYSELDSLGRCGVAYANICRSIMPTTERGSISSVRPSGFVQNKFDILKTESNPAGYMWARCHLIAYALAGENANPLNLVTGTLNYFNVEGMEPFELAVSYYVKSKDGDSAHVLYRVVPLFYADELVCRGVLMEAQSVEDNGLSFCVFVYNVQPGIVIDYATGNTWLAD